LKPMALYRECIISPIGWVRIQLVWEEVPHKEYCP